MTTFLIRRLIWTIVAAFILSIAIFLLIRQVPGDIVTLLMGMEGRMSPEQQATLRTMFGLSDPVPVQYVKWLGRTLQGDLGVSFRSRQPVMLAIQQALPVSIELALLASFISAVIALPLGILSAVRRNTKTDLLARVLGLIGLSMPSFWLAVILILISATYFHWLPPLFLSSLFQDPVANLKKMIMPAAALALPLMGVVMRMTRSSMLEVLNEDYVRTARAKGVQERVVVLIHALKNSLIPVITVMGIQLGRTLGGVVIVEQIFGLPGVGNLLVSAIAERDYPTVQATVLLMGLLFLTVQFIVDLSYAYIDPRIRYD